MSCRFLSILGVLAAASFGQTANQWKAPRTADGKPDLQGVWTNGTLTTFQRPPELKDKEFFTEDEAVKYAKQRIVQTDVDRPEARRPGDTGAYNNFWMDRGNSTVKTRRTSIVVDPPDGRVPPFTPEGQKRYANFKAYSAAHPADGPEDRFLSERCLLFGASGPPMLPEPYNNNYQIVQSPGYVTILAEMNHEARIIPMDGRPHLGAGMNQWQGSSRGHWEGDTLVVESTGFKFNDQSRFGVSYLDGMTDQNLRVTERFTRIGPDVIMYRATIDDPTVYSKPWTVELSMTKRTDALYEYACNEGNYGMANLLSGTRAEEKKSR